MAAIKKDFGFGGGNVAPGGSAGTPDLATALRDVADDLAAVVGTTPVAASAAGATYTSAEQTLLNELRTAVQALQAVTVKTTKV